ncbi:ligand-binding sensor domain-containing protein [Maribellus mangrovi]|uniref:ligand-binding sensor domain-containing protein n=1 Tax=Maribellus mangrovi TaxID=3133146 RepID=UPI0030EED518
MKPKQKGFLLIFKILLRAFILCAVFLFANIASVSQEMTEPELFHCTAIGQEEGLVQLNVKSLTLDELGYLWVGTEDGLLRYNGFEFKSFLHDPVDSFSIADDHIRGMLFSGGKLWIATNSKGIIYYVPAEDRFYNFTNDNMEPDLLTGYKILLPVKDTLVFSIQNNLFVVNDKSGEHSRMKLPHTAKECVVNDVLPLGDNRCWMATTSAGILEVDKNVCEFAETQLLENNTNNCFHKIDQQVFIGTEEGLFTYDLEKNSLHSTSFTNPVNCFYPISKNTFYLGTDVGLFRYNQSDETITPEIIKTQNDVLHAQLDINQILGDDKGNIWIGTEGDGLFHYNRYQRKFAPIKLQLDEFPLSSNISTFQFLPTGDFLWLGTKYGMVKYNFKTSKFQFYESEHKPLIYTIAKDEDNAIWAGGFTSGLLRYDPKNDIFETVKSDFPDNDIVEIIPRGNNRLWICTWAGGIHSYNVETRESQEVMIDDKRINRARCSLIDSKGNTWLGTDEGAFCITPRLEAKQYIADVNSDSGLSGERIFSISEDRTGNIWLGTNVGLTMLDVQTDKTTLFYKQKGLPNDFIYAVLIAANNDVWVSTNYGISVLRRESNSFTNFTVSDGLQNNEFNGKAGYQDKEGNFYFGGISGFNIFKPEDLIENPHTPKVYIESAELFNKPLNRNELFADELSFKSRENVLTFNYTALNYLAPQKCNFSYQMEGFDQDWRPVTKNRSTTYTNLDPGTYTFKVRATNDAGTWSTFTDQLTITIVPPWYASNWFRMLFIFVFLLSGIVFYFYQTNKLKREKLKLEKIVSHRTRQVRDKNRELESAYHEATEQRDQVRFLMKEMRHRVNNNLQIISSLLSIQGNRVKSPEAVDVLEMARNRILAIAQVENKIKSDSERIEIGSFIREIAENIIHALSGANNLKFKSTFEIERIEVENINTTLIGLIVNELITNTTKHAFEKSSTENELRISCTLKDEILTLTVADNGKGFDPAQFGSDSMGMSLVEGMVQQLEGKLSIEGKLGTVVKIEIPVKTTEA